MTRVLITGATGLLGTRLVPYFADHGYLVSSHGRGGGAELAADLTSLDETSSLISKVAPDVILNLVAMSDVDACEAEPDSAYRANILTVQNLCAAIKQVLHPCHLIQISTDMVYDTAGPNSEEQITIRNTYAMTKLAAEYLVVAAGGTVLRTNFFGRSARPGRASLTDWLHGALKQQSSITVFDDVLFSPLSIGTLSSSLDLVSRLRPAGVFNLGSRNGMSKADFAFAFADQLNLPSACMQRGRSTSLSSLKAKRPRDMRMDCRRLESIGKIRLPDLSEEISLMGEEYRE